jgi:hypothetical protein
MAQRAAAVLHLHHVGSINDSAAVCFRQTAGVAFPARSCRTAYVGLVLEVSLPPFPDNAYGATTQVQAAGPSAAH